MSDQIKKLSKFDFDAMRAQIEQATTASEKAKMIVNAPFDYIVAVAFLFLEIVMLLEVSEDGKSINRCALSTTELAKNTVAVSFVPFDEIKIPVDHLENIISSAIRTGKPQDTTTGSFFSNRR